MAVIQLLVAILATYRLARLLPEDEGPFFVFSRLREFTGTKALTENEQLGFWANIDSGIHCAYCCGLYAAVLVAILVVWQNVYANIFLLVFAIAGGQTLLQKLTE